MQVCSHQAVAQQQEGLVPANGLQVCSVWVLGSSGKTDGGPEDEVGDGKGIHQGAADPPELTAQLLNHPLDGLGFLRRNIVIVAEQDVLLNALQRKQVGHGLHMRAHAIGRVT